MTAISSLPPFFQLVFLLSTPVEIKNKNPFNKWKHFIFLKKEKNLLLRAHWKQIYDESLFGPFVQVPLVFLLLLKTTIGD